MSLHTIHLRSYSPDLLVEFDLPPGTHARIGASPEAEISLPLSEFGAFPCTIGRFQDGRLYLANSDGTIERRLDLPSTVSFPPYEFHVFHPEEPVPVVEEATIPKAGAAVADRIQHLADLFRKSPAGSSTPK